MTSLDNVTGPETENRTPLNGGAMLTITPAAADRIRHLLAQKQPQPQAVMVSVTSKGCSGLRYDLQYLDRMADKPKFADEVTQNGVTVVIDPKATLYIVGSVMDYKESPTRSGFDFTNPNETGRCGCGESFSVAPAEKH
jgi:iron-sulfur cluster assembly accessory protein